VHCQPNVDGGDYLSQWEMTIFDTQSTPLNRSPKNLSQVTDYVGDPYSCAKFGARPSTGGLLGEWAKYNYRYFYGRPE